MAQTRPAVAIIMRTRERPVLLRRALADVCAQSSTDWHLVVVNDGGDPAEVDELVAAQPALAERATVLHNELPGGMEAASNRALAASDSTYVAIHDDDDTWHPGFLAATVSQLEATGQAAVAVRTEIVWEQIDGESITEVEREVFEPGIGDFTLFEMLRANRTVPISILYRRDVHDRIGPFREDLSAVGDWEFHLRLGASGLPLGFLDGEPLAFWHQRRTAEGPLANSVIGNRDDHLRLDLRVREEALREHARQHGLGGLLYVTKYFQRELDLVHERITYGESRLHEIVDLLRRDEERARRLGELLDRQAEAVPRQTELAQRQDELLHRLEERLGELERAVSDASLVSLLRRRYRRLKAARPR